jgi:hypothetical protein
MEKDPQGLNNSIQNYAIRKIKILESRNRSSERVAYMTRTFEEIENNLNELLTGYKEINKKMNSINILN